MPLTHGRSPLCILSDTMAHQSIQCTFYTSSLYGHSPKIAFCLWCRFVATPNKWEKIEIHFGSSDECSVNNDDNFSTTFFWFVCFQIGIGSILGVKCIFAVGLFIYSLEWMFRNEKWKHIFGSFIVCNGNGVVCFRNDNSALSIELSHWSLWSVITDYHWFGAKTGKGQLFGVLNWIFWLVITFNMIRTRFISII